MERWVWTREHSDRWCAQPLWAMRVIRTKPGRELKSPPKRLDGVERYGYDSAGRLLLAQRYEDGGVRATVIAREGDDVSVRWEFDAFESLASVTRAVPNPSTGRVLSACVRFSEIQINEQYAYDDEGRLRRVRFEREGDDYDSSPARRRGEQRISYGPDGEPVRVVEYQDAPSQAPHILWATDLGEWDELAAVVKGPLVEAISRAVAEQVHGEIALLCLMYTSAGVAAPPPGVFACPAGRHRELIDAYGPDPIVLLAPEWGVDQLELHLSDETTEACESLSLLAHQGDARGDSPRLLMLSLAQELARSMPFPVYALDAEGEDLERNLPASVPGERIASLLSSR